MNLLMLLGSVVGRVSFGFYSWMFEIKWLEDGSVSGQMCRV